MTDQKMMEALGKVFACEVEGALNGGIQICQLPKRMTEQLVKAGLVERAEHQLRDRFGVMTVNGCILTHAGRLLYCLSCKDEPEPAGESP